MPNPSFPPGTHFVVVHKPGPRWKEGVSFREQPGVSEHVEYYGKLYKQGKVIFGGPFLDTASGGMMVLAANVSEHEAKDLATADPAAKAGLLHFDIRPWWMAFDGKK